MGLKTTSFLVYLRLRTKDINRCLLLEVCPVDCDLFPLWWQQTRSSFPRLMTEVFLSMDCDCPRQRCSTRVQDLDSSPTWVPFFGTWAWDLWTWIRAWHLRTWDLDLTHPDLNLIFKVFLHFSLMENPDSQSEILNHLLWKSIKVDLIGSSLFSKPLWHWINSMVYQCI